MKRKTFKLGEDTVTLPRGSRVLLKVDLRGEDGFVHRASTAAIVREVFHNSYVLETPSGRRLKAERDQIQMAREDLLAELGKRQLDFERLYETVMYEAVVGSRAWGLADETSDEDVRGWFLLPFEDWASLWHAPDEIQSPDRDAAYWEIEKLLYQALRADANTLECLWSPLHKKTTPLGESLLEIRNGFISMNVLGSFGRYFFILAPGRYSRFPPLDWRPVPRPESARYVRGSRSRAERSGGGISVLRYNES